MALMLERDRLIYDPPSLGTVLYLPGLPGGGSKIYDRSPYGNIGTITGATWVRTPDGLWCLSFDGDDHVDCGSGASLATTGTWECWLNRTDRTDTMYICDFRDSGGGAGYILLPLNGDTLAYDAGTAYVDGSVSDECTQAVWHHVAVAGIVFTAGAPLIIARRGPSAQDWWKGQMALVRFHNRLLSALEIQNHYNREKHLFGVW